MVEIDDYWLTLLLSVILPMVVALITKSSASGTVKSVTLLALAAITGTLTAYQQAGGGPLDVKMAIINTVVSFVIAVGIHFGLLKEINVTGSEGVIQRKTSTFGLGKHEVTLAA